MIAKGIYYAKVLTRKPSNINRINEQIYIIFYFPKQRLWKCSHKRCSPLVKMFRDEEEKLMDLCREKGLAISLRRNFITISSPRSKWRILADDNRNRTMLYHCNDFDYENASPVPGYHNQHVNYATLQEYLDYIIDHDYYRMMHPLYPAPQPKAPPIRGTKRYRTAQVKEKRKAKKAAVWNVPNIIDSLSAQNQTRAVV